MTVCLPKTRPKGQERASSKHLLYGFGIWVSCLKSQDSVASVQTQQESTADSQMAQSGSQDDERVQPAARPGLALLADEVLLEQEVAGAISKSFVQEVAGAIGEACASSQSQLQMPPLALPKPSIEPSKLLKGPPGHTGHMTPEDAKMCASLGYVPNAGPLGPPPATPAGPAEAEVELEMDVAMDQRQSPTPNMTPESCTPPPWAPSQHSAWSSWQTDQLNVELRREVDVDAGSKLAALMDEGAHEMRQYKIATSSFEYMNGLIL